MAKVTYVTLGERPHIGHITWLRAMRTLGHEIKLVSLQRPGVFINHGDVLITEGVRPTAFGITQRLFFKCWAAVANSPSILNPTINKLYTIPDLVISVSRLVKDLINNDSVIIHPVPPELEMLLKIDVNSRKPWICFSGAFIPIKGLHIIPEIALYLKNEGIKAEFLLIGGSEGDPLGQFIINKAKKLDVEDYIRLINFLPRAKLFNLLSKCFVYLQSSLFDAFSISVVETMALGVIPVVTKYVGSKELVELIDKSLIRNFKPKDIAETIAWLFTNEKTTKEYSKLSREVIKDVLSFSSIMNRVNEFLEVCLR